MRARVLALSALVSVTLLAAPAQALEPDPAAPIVVDDSVTLWPGQARYVDVLANDSDPGGDLALCRVPGSFGDPDRPPVAIYDTSVLGGPADELMVEAAPRARGTHVADYHVCNHTHLTPAHLTVTIRPVEPVDVVPAKRHDHVRVTNHNDRVITFVGVERRQCDLDAYRRGARRHHDGPRPP